MEQEIARLTALADSLNLDVWKNTYTQLDVRLTPSEQQQFLPALSSNGPLDMKVLQEDLGETVRDNYRPSAGYTSDINATKKKNTFFNDFHDLDGLIG